MGGSQRKGGQAEYYEAERELDFPVRSFLAEDGTVYEATYEVRRPGEGCEKENVRGFVAKYN